MSSGSLRAFVARAARTLQAAKTEPGRPVRFVVGNESCDLDSITSSIVYAYLGSHEAKTLTKVAVKQDFVPILNIPRDEIAIRPELLELLKQVDLEPASLLSLDDLDELAPNLDPQQTSWVLVDHNALTGTLAKRFGNRVVGCIDHHIDEKVTPETDEAPHIIEACGSCTSLVVNHFRDVWDQLSMSATFVPTQAQDDAIAGADDQVSRFAWDASLAKLAMASILVDTQNLESKHKVKEGDIKAVEYLQAKIDLSPKDNHRFDRTKFYELIDNAKTNIAGMTVRDCLRKDYKQWTEEGKTIGVTTIVCSLEALKEKIGSAQGLQTEIESFGESKELDICGVMTAFTDAETNDFRRELLILPIKASMDSFAADFENEFKEKFQLERHGLSVRNQHGRAWWQRALTSSRKQVAPALRESLRDFKSRI